MIERYIEKALYLRRMQIQVSTLSAPAAVMRSATSFAVMGSRERAFLS